MNLCKVSGSNDRYRIAITCEKNTATKNIRNPLRDHTIIREVSMPNRTSNQSPTILLVDDDPDSITLLSYILRDHYRVKVASSGEAALRMAHALPAPDLIILDILMPPPDGFKVCEELKSNPATRTIPIIFLTSLADKLNKRIGLELGAAAYINKPVNPEEVLACVRQTIMSTKNSATILVVDDNPDSLTLLSYILKDHYRVKVADSGAAALRAARVLPAPDLIILDVMMPGPDGFKVGRDLKSDPATRNIPIIFLTSLLHKEDRRIGLELGAAAYINKPVNPEEVLACVRLSLAKKKLTAQS